METGLVAQSGGRQMSKKERPQRELEVEGFQEGKYRWCNKGNDDSCHRCGHEGHISRLCARDMPSSMKELVISGARAFAAHRAYHDLQEQNSPDISDNDTTPVQGHGAAEMAPLLI